jgi:hypothetical protein
VIKIGAGPLRVPFHLPELIARLNDPIILLEGEKGVIRAQRAGLLATCVQGQIWTDLIADYFADRDVIIPPDFDDKGEANLTKALDHLLKVKAQVRVLRLPGLERRQDLYDWLEAGHTAEELLALAETQPIQGQVNIAPYVFPEEKDIAPYEYLYGIALQREEIAVTIALGGTGKSNLNIAEALAIASGRPLLGHTVPPDGARVLLVNMEDSRNTMDKRIAAALRAHQLTPKDLGGRLFVVAKNEVAAAFGGGFRVATGDKWGKVTRNEALIEGLIEYLIAHTIDVLIVDPLTLAHDIRENDPTQFRAAIEVFGTVAGRARCAVSLWHHTRKENGSEMTIESSRGALSLMDTVRYARLGEKMTRTEAQRLKLKDHWRYFRLFNGKANYAPPVADSEWYKIETVPLENGFPFGEDVSAVVSWAHPGAEALIPTPADLAEIGERIAKGLDREDFRAAAWAGRAVAQVLGLDHDEHRPQIIKLLKKMANDGTLKLVSQKTKAGMCATFTFGPTPRQ